MFYSIIHLKLVTTYKHTIKEIKTNYFKVAIILLFSTSCLVRSFGNVFIFLMCQQGWKSVCQLKSVPLTKGNIKHSTGMINVKVACFDFGQRSWNNWVDFARILFGKEGTVVGDTEVIRLINRHPFTDSKTLCRWKVEYMFSISS